jgi:hypothetical protein
MQKLSLIALGRELLSKAVLSEEASASSGARAAQTVHGGHEKALRQTVIALAKDAALAEHASPGEATIYVLHGRRLLGGPRRRPAAGSRRAAQSDRTRRLRRAAHRRQAAVTCVVARCLAAMSQGAANLTE